MVCEPTWAQLLSWNNRPPEVTHRPWQWMVGRQASPFRKVTFQGRTVKRWWFMARINWDVRSLYQPRSNVKTKSTADPAIFDAWMWPRWWGSAGHVRVSQFFFVGRSWSGSCQHGNLTGFCGVPPKTFGDALVFIDGSILEMDQTCIVDLKCFPTETTCG